MPVDLSAALAAADDGGHLWAAAGLSFRPAPGGTLYAGPGFPSGILLSDEARPGLALGAAATEAIARLERPVLVAPGDTLTLWLAWPLPVSVRWGEREVDTVRVGGRQTIFGPVPAGRVLPAATCRLLAGWDADPLPPHEAALRVVVRSTADRPLALRRVPLNEARLALFQGAERLAGGDVLITVRSAEVAEAATSPGEPPPGMARVHAPTGDAPATQGPLSWLLDGTRRSVEFQL